MSTDYVALSCDNIKVLLAKQPNVLTAALAAAMGMTAAEHAAFLAAVGAVLPAVTEIVALQDQLDAKTAVFPDILDAQMPPIRAAIKRAKTSPGCTAEVQTNLDWIGASLNQDPEHSRPTIIVEPQRARVKIGGRKPGFEAVSIYSRIKGQVQWKLIAVRKRKFPFYDESPLAVAVAPAGAPPKCSVLAGSEILWAPLRETGWYPTAAPFVKLFPSNLPRELLSPHTFHESARTTSSI